MKFIWTQGKNRVKRFTISVRHRKTGALEEKKEQHYCLAPGNFYCGELPVGIIDIEGRERAKKALDS
jgi:hypothetical protein